MYHVLGASFGRFLHLDYFQLGYLKLKESVRALFTVLKLRFAIFHDLPVLRVDGFARARAYASFQVISYQKFLELWSWLFLFSKSE